MKIGIVGSREYENKLKIKEFIFQLKEKFGDELVIVSGGQDKGADGYAKKISLGFDVKYAEFPPVHYSYNQHCVLKRGRYGKKYYVGNFFARNKQIAEYSDMVVGFIPEGANSNGTRHTLSEAEKLGKKILIIN
jgi:predicted Rossmann fold nucleotide-binding protein DprA/Smf involved in DNA uptake